MSALRALGPIVPRACEETDRYVVVVDLGRWCSDHPAGELLHAADSVVMVIAPIEGVEHSRSRLAARPVDPARIMVVTVGDRPYGTAEIARALGTPGRAIAFNRLSAELMALGWVLDRWLRRSPLVR